ncbi:uncharacterized protein LOC144127865 [Amblyomma americanum]
MAYAHQKSTGQHCAVYGCTNNQRKRTILGTMLCPQHSTRREDRRCDMFTLHRFPASPDLRRQWAAAVNRKYFTIAPWSRVCSRHFVGRKKTDQNAVPALHLGYQRKVVLGRRRLVRHEHIPPAKKMKRKPRDENAGASDGGPLDFSTDALAQKAAHEGNKQTTKTFRTQTLPPSHLRQHKQTANTFKTRTPLPNHLGQHKQIANSFKTQTLPPNHPKEHKHIANTFRTQTIPLNPLRKHKQIANAFRTLSLCQPRQHEQMVNRFKTNAL